MGTTSDDEMSLESDVRDPATEDWQGMEDSDLYHAAKSGVPQAKQELDRRENAIPTV